MILRVKYYSFMCKTPNGHVSSHTKNRFPLHEKLLKNSSKSRALVVFRLCICKNLARQTFSYKILQNKLFCKNFARSYKINFWPRLGWKLVKANLTDACDFTLKITYIAIWSYVPVFPGKFVSSCTFFYLIPYQYNLERKVQNNFFSLLSHVDSP